jgi:hypothetical protein
MKIEFGCGETPTKKNFVKYKSFNGDKSKHLHVEFYK